MARCRLRLYGKKVTQDDILEEINRLLYGKGNRPFPLKPSEIGKVIGLNRTSVYGYIKKLSQRGDLPKLPSGRLALPKVDEREYRRFNEHHEITSDPLVSEWMTDHFIQGTAYSEMFKELSGIEVKQVVILVSSEKNTRMEFVKRTEDYKDMLRQRLDQFYANLK